MESWEVYVGLCGSDTKKDCEMVPYDYVHREELGFYPLGIRNL